MRTMIGMYAGENLVNARNVKELANTKNLTNARNAQVDKDPKIKIKNFCATLAKIQKRKELCGVAKPAMDGEEYAANVKVNERF